MITPTQEYRRTGHNRPGRLLTGLDATVDALTGRYHRRGSIAAQLAQDAARA